MSDPASTTSTRQARRPGLVAEALPPLLLACALAGLYCAAAASLGWFVDPRRYGIGEDGTQWASTLAGREAHFFLWQLFLVGPASLSLGFALTRASLDAGRPFAAIAGRIERLRRPALAGAIFLASAGLVGALSFASLGGTLITDDENAYLFQARILASGRLTVPSPDPPMREAVDNVFIVNNGRRFCHYPFGHAAALAAGVLAGRPHLVPAMASGLIVVLVFWIGRDIYGPRTALAAAALLVVSPQFLLTGATLLSQPTSLLLTAVSILGLVRALGRGSVAWAAAGGLAWGIAAHVRVGTVFLLTLPLLVHFAVRLAAEPRRLWKPAAAAAASCALAVGLYLATNAVVNGSPFRTNYHAMWENDPTGQTSPVGFGAYPWEIEHTPLRGAWNTALNVLKLDFWFLGTPLSLVPLVAYLLLRPRDRWDRIWLATLALTPLAYFFYFWPGVADTGPVHFYELLLPLALLTARALARVSERAAAAAGGGTRRLVANTVLSAIVLGIVSFTPVQVATLREIAARAREPYEFIRARGIRRAIVFMDAQVRTPPKSWLLGRLNGSPDLTDDVLYLRDLKGKNWEIAKLYPERTLWRLRYGTNGLIRLERLIPPRVRDEGDAS